MSDPTYDVVLVLDLTTRIPLLDGLKAETLKLNGYLRSALAAKNRQIGRLRVRIVGYGDFYTNGAGSIFECPSSSSRTRSVTSRL